LHSEGVRWSEDGSGDRRTLFTDVMVILIDWNEIEIPNHFLARFSASFRWCYFGGRPIIVA